MGQIFQNRFFVRGCTWGVQETLNGVSFVRPSNAVNRVPKKNQGWRILKQLEEINLLSGIPFIQVSFVECVKVKAFNKTKVGVESILEIIYG